MDCIISFLYCVVLSSGGILHSIGMGRDMNNMQKSHATIKPLLEWEPMDDDSHERARVPGGWLVKTHQDVLVSLHEDMQPSGGYAWQTSMTFVPDPAHIWGKDHE